MKGAGFLILSVCLLMFSSAPFAETSHVGASVEAFNFRFVGTESVTVVVPDDFLTIQEAINNAVEGDTIFVKSGIYYEHVVVNKTVSLIGEDRRTTIIDGNWTGVVVNVTRDGVVVSDVTVQRSGSIYWRNAGILLDNVEACRISENILTQNSFAGLELNYSRHCGILGNLIISNGGVGITLVGGNSNDLSRNNITENGWSALTLNDDANNNTISENNMASNNLAVTGHCINLYRSSNNFIYKNKITDDDNGIRLEYWSSFNTISQNNITDNTLTGISVERYSDSNTISGNTITGGRFGVSISNSRYTVVCDNTIAQTYGSDIEAGIYLESAGYTKIYENEITDNWRSILVYASSPYVSVYGNNITSNEHGIAIARGGSNYCNVSENYVANNHAYGIALTGLGRASNYITVARNLIVNNTLEGVGIGQGSSYNMVIQNNIVGNGYGIYIDLFGPSTQNKIFNNNIVNNTQQVRIALGSVNTWDSSYPSGGNYWSDYTGVDLKSCPNQDVPGSDGIGDTPYVIDAYNRDNYPLMEPYTFPVGIRDVTVLKVTPCINVTWMGSPVDINVTVRNKGDYVDNRSVTVYFDSSLIGTQTVTVAPGENVTLTFTWDTISVAPGSHAIKAVANMVFAEANIADNTLVDGTVRIKMPGDLNGDNKTDIKDMAVAALAFGSYNYPVTSPRWNPDADINGDGRIDIRDLALIARHFGEVY